MAMKLFFVAGRKGGQQLDLNPPGISIGRESDNDVVLEGEGASRYHAKLDWRDGSWFVRDLGSTNGTKVNDGRIGEHQLQVGDRIRIGEQEMLFADDRGTPAPLPGSGPTPAPAAAATVANQPAAQTHQDISGAKSFQNFFTKGEAEPPAAKVSFFGGKPGSHAVPNGGKRHISAMVYALVIGMAIAIAAGFLVWDMGNRKRELIVLPTSAQRSPLLVIYEKREASGDNVFRFRLEIRDRLIRIDKDDLKNRIRSTKQKEVGDQQLADLERRLRETDFMALEEQAPGVSADRHDRRRTLTVAYGRELNHIEIRNAFAPVSFEEAATQVEEFSRDILNTPTEYLTPEEMLQEGTSAYTHGEELYRNFEANPRNLLDAITRFSYAIEMLENFEPKPPEYELAFQLRRESETMLKTRIQTAKRESIRAIKLKDYPTARTALRATMEMTESGEKEHEAARKTLIRIEDELRKKNK